MSARIGLRMRKFVCPTALASAIMHITGKRQPLFET